MDIFGPVVTIIFFIVIVFCTFIVGWMTGYERSRREIMQALKMSYERRGIIESPPIDTAFEPYTETQVYDLASFRQKKEEKEGDAPTLEWGLIWSERDQVYVKVPQGIRPPGAEED